MDRACETGGTAGDWRPSGVVALLTDFGTRDTYIGVVKAVVLAEAPRATLVDLTHEVPPQDVATAAFHLREAARWFPAGSVLVAVVDPGVGSARRILVARDGERCFLAPDNGLLGPVLGPRADVRALDVERFSLPRRSRTFHGRDVFAPAAGRIAAGLAPEECGPPAGEVERIELPAPVREDGGIAGEVLVVDRFGNLVSNVPAEWLDGSARGAWSVELGGRRVRLVGAYAEAERGELVALVGSHGLVEVAERDGDAARALGLGRGARVLVGRGS